eukprot:TRINITY_DN70586_c0_g1_i1.p1 TRINITY_DN70586_c0_g1~~TRINITY_DN70586_c0_g1_i1.p1  ORF type:complete len:588 (+),score=93.75 TRINITY_DN70586_c0_g1_i1:78-1766(+)
MARGLLPSEVLVAIRENDVGGLEDQLMEHPQAVNATDDFGWTPLHHAALQGLVRAVAVLLEYGANVNRGTRGMCERPLHIAASRGHVDVCSMMRTAGADVDARNAYGDSPLHAAAAAGQLQAVQWLTGAGADVLAENAQWQTPKEVARGDGALRIASLLGAAEAAERSIAGRRRARRPPGATQSTATGASSTAAVGPYSPPAASPQSAEGEGANGAVWAARPPIPESLPPRSSLQPSPAQATSPSSAGRHSSGLPPPVERPPAAPPHLCSSALSSPRSASFVPSRYRPSAVLRSASASRPRTGPHPLSSTGMWGEFIRGHRGRRHVPPPPSGEEAPPRGPPVTVTPGSPLYMMPPAGSDLRRLARRSGHRYHVDGASRRSMSAPVRDRPVGTEGAPFALEGQPAERLKWTPQSPRNPITGALQPAVHPQSPRQQADPTHSAIATWHNRAPSPRGARHRSAGLSAARLGLGEPPPGQPEPGSPLGSRRRRIQRPPPAASPYPTAAPSEDRHGKMVGIRPRDHDVVNMQLERRTPRAACPRAHPSCSQDVGSLMRWPASVGASD